MGQRSPRCCARPRRGPRQLFDATRLAGGWINPDRPTHEELAANLTNSLIPDVVSTPGNEAMIGEFQESGFVYSYA
jgi:hypothetical protein